MAHSATKSTANIRPVLVSEATPRADAPPSII